MNAARCTFLSTVMRINYTLPGYFSNAGDAVARKRKFNSSSVSLVKSDTSLHTVLTHSQNEAEQNFVRSPHHPDKPQAFLTDAEKMYISRSVHTLL